MTREQMIDEVVRKALGTFGFKVSDWFKYLNDSEVRDWFKTSVGLDTLSVIRMHFANMARA